MYREIKKKQLILENRKPYPQEISAHIREVNLMDWIYSSMHLDGTSLSKEETLTILRGGLVVGATMEDHRLVSAYKAVIQLSHSMHEMMDHPDEIGLKKLYLALTDLPAVQFTYRRTNPILYTLHYNPPHFNAVEEQMELFFDWLVLDDPDSNPIRKAVESHNKLVEIYPFPDHNEAMARILLNHQLVQSGYPPIAIAMSEQEYNQALAEYLRTGRSQALYDVVERSLYNKLEVLLQLTNLLT